MTVSDPGYVKCTIKMLVGMMINKAQSHTYGIIFKFHIKLFCVRFSQVFQFAKEAMINMYKLFISGESTKQLPPTHQKFLQFHLVFENFAENIAATPVKIFANWS